MLREKGRLVVPKPVKKSTEEERNMRARIRAKTKLGEDKYKRLRDSYIRFQKTEGVNKTLLDGVIIGLRIPINPNILKYFSNMNFRTFKRYFLRALSRFSMSF